MVDDTLIISGPLSPDAVRLPGAPSNLKLTVQSLAEVVADLKNVSQIYKQANPESPTSGRVLRAVAHVAQVTGQVLEGDTDQLQALSDAITHEAELLSSTQSQQLPELRQRWDGARHSLRTAVDEENRRNRNAAAQAREVVPAGAGAHAGGGGHHAAADGGAAAPAQHEKPEIDADDLIRGIEGDAFEHYAPIFRRATGATYTSPQGQAHATLVESGGALETAMSQFRNTLHAVFEEYSDVARRVLSADDEIEAKLMRNNHSVLVAHAVDDGTGPQVGISSVQEIQKLSESVRNGNNSLNNLSQKLQQASDSLNQGRLRDHDDQSKHTNGQKFAHEWDAHFDELRHNVNQALDHAGSVADKMQQLDEQGAHEVRRAGNADG